MPSDPERLFARIWLTNGILELMRWQRVHVALATIAVAVLVGACNDPFRNTEASFTYTSTLETGASTTRTGSDATWLVRQGLGQDGFNHKFFFLAMTSP